jgi:hypothetical protein
MISTILISQPPSGWLGLDELRREPLHPPVYGHVIDGDATLGQQLLHIAVRQAVAQVPADRDREDFPREPEASEH